MVRKISDFKNVFFIGIAGAGMSAIAQYLKGIGKKVSGSDRYFSSPGENKTKKLLEAEGIACYPQDGIGISHKTDLVVISTAIEETVGEMVKARKLNIPVIKRGELLSMIAKSKKTIAVAGTSGKSSTAAMLYQILRHADLEPSIIAGAGLIQLIRENKLGNAAVGSGDWLIIEADESDGSIVNYTPEVGLLLNIDKDHQEPEALEELFGIFRKNTRGLFVVNQGNVFARKLSVSRDQDFGVEVEAGFSAHNFSQKGFRVFFSIENQRFEMPALGKHNVENATAAIAVALQLGISPHVCAESLSNYEGIYRRSQILGYKSGVWVIDDYAHNPAKCAASIRSCQPLTNKVVAWFQPHGYRPTRFLRKEFVLEIASALREEDEIWMSEIFYAGGSVIKDISAKDLTDGISALGKKAFFVENREEVLKHIRPSLSKGSVLLLMGARDPGLEEFSQGMYDRL
ncbi:MAG: UDP-N-acetylmuramate--alanine ligase [Bergeyella sp.]|nr:UDP-N-acetylmuramate--alanine ligase [Bergeyella sp.]